MCEYFSVGYNRFILQVLQFVTSVSLRQSYISKEWNLWCFEESLGLYILESSQVVMLFNPRDFQFLLWFKTIYIILKLLGSVIMFFKIIL